MCNQSTVSSDYELVIREALSAYSKQTLGKDRAIAEELALNARYVAEQYLYAPANQ